jgi:uncharacterized protein
MTGTPDSSAAQSPNPRINRIDLLRGFAMYGVLVVHLFGSRTVGPHTEGSVIAGLIHFFIEEKFYPLLALLFGLGFALQMKRLSERGASVTTIYIRRSLALAGIGMAIYAGLMAQPLLVHYGVMGLGLLLFRQASRRTIIAGIAVFCLLAVFYNPVRQLLRAPAANAHVRASAEPTRRVPPRFARQEQVFEQGSFAEISAYRAHDIARQVVDPEFYINVNQFERCALYLLGLLVALSGILTGPTMDPRFLRKVAIAGLGLGLAGCLLLYLPAMKLNYADSFSTFTARRFLLTFAGPILGFGYAALLLLFWERSPALQRRLSGLEAIGQTALTNFLLQYVFIFSLFWLQRWDIIDFTPPGAALAFSIVVFAVELRLSAWWLKRYRFGPVEWLWRAATFGSWPRLRIAAAPPLRAAAPAHD